MMMKMIKLTLLVLLIVPFSCREELDDMVKSPIEPVLNFNSLLKSTAEQGDTLIRAIGFMADGSQSTGPIRSFQINWDNGNYTDMKNINSNDEIAVVGKYMENGVYDVKLTVFTDNDGYGLSRTAQKTVWVLDSIIIVIPTPARSDKMLILVDSTYLGNGIWNNHFKAHKSGLKSNVPGQYFCPNDGGNPKEWNVKPINDPDSEGYIHFYDVIGSTRFSVFNRVISATDITDNWYEMTPDVNYNETSRSEHNDFGCWQVMNDEDHSFLTAFIPGRVGDQLISIESIGNNVLRVYVKFVNFAYSAENAGAYVQFEDGWKVVDLQKVNDDPSRWSSFDIDKQVFFYSGDKVGKFKLLPNKNDTSKTFLWSGSFWAYPPELFITHPEEYYYAIQETSL